MRLAIERNSVGEYYLHPEDWSDALVEITQELSITPVPIGQGYEEVRRQLSEFVLDHPRVLLLGGSGYAQSENVVFEDRHYSLQLDEIPTALMHLTELFNSVPDGIFVIRKMIIEKNGYTMRSQMRYQLCVNLAVAEGNQAGMLRGVIRKYFIDNALEGL